MREFIDLVAQMRNAQTSYFRARKSKNKVNASIALTESKKLERQVDDFIAQYKQNLNQPKLF